ncbi:MAG: LLM class flavin-dependent oxidoreductase [Labilithrix sp.]|nr:LLM class flavin-dependent oxidoreductase [Labilithrix sp.]
MTTLDNVPFNVLDLAWRDFGKTNSDAVRASVELARKAEDLGFRRYWFAEHHGLPVSASSTPAILVGAVAAATTTMRVGSGGVMLPNYAPLSVAEQFGTLKALYGDRIDLGIGRASGTDGVTTHALRRTREGLDVSSYPRDLLDLLGFFRGSQEAPTSPLLAVPGLGDGPEIWLLGSSTFSAQLAGRLGLPFAFAHHFSSDRTEQALDLYRQAFTPSELLEAPYSMISVMLIVDDSRDVVRAEMLPSAITFLQMLQGKRPEPVSVEAALAYDLSPRERELVTQRNARQAVGTPDEVEARLRSLVASTGANELMFQLHGATATGRQRSLEIVTSLRTSRAPTPRGEAS